MTTSNRALADLARWLREQRARSGRTYRELATRTKCTATTLQRAASGDSVPTRTTVLSYARACDASSETALVLWKAARYEEVVGRRRRRPAPKPEAIWDVPELIEALVDLYRRAGAPSVRLMEARAGGYGVLPRSAAHRIVTRQLIPRNRSQFVGFLVACEVPEADWDVWTTAWSRALRPRPEERDIFIDGKIIEVKDTHTSPWFDGPVPPPRPLVRQATGRRLLQRNGRVQRHEPTQPFLIPPSALPWEEQELPGLEIDL